MKNFISLYHSLFSRAMLAGFALAFAMTCAGPASAETKKASAHQQKSAKPAKKTKATASKTSAKAAAKKAPAVTIPTDSVQSAFFFAERKDWSNALAHARISGKQPLAKLITWMKLQDQESGASFADITAFLRANPGWPRQDRLKLRAEQSLRSSEVSDEALARWFAENPPVSGAGKIKLAELRMKKGVSLQSDDIRYLVRDGWRNGDFDENEENRLLTVYADILRKDDHALRTDRLIWEEKNKPASRMLPLLPEEQRQLMRARIALLEDASDATFQLSHVPQALLNDPGLTYARLQWRARKQDDAGVREMLLAAPVPAPYPEKWWKPRERAIREAIDDRDYALARRLLANHGQADGQELADATWLSGWLSLQFLNNPQDAYQQFYKMYDGVKYPVSRSRAAYWAARAAQAANDTEASASWLRTASAYPTTFYGQLAYAALNPAAPLALPAEPPLQKDRFPDNDLVAIIRLAADAHQYDTAAALLNHLIDTVPDAQVAYAAQLGAQIHDTTLGVKGAKRATQRNILLSRTGYPQVKLDADLDVEPALALAITRQESEFDRFARSRANAIGMMQLLPGTAKEQAKKSGIPYSESRLTESDYNIQLGSAYLARLINAYDGSYVQGIAAYNAGPGNVRNWRGRFGAPGSSVEATVDWIEKIPFAETRNYVQRVLENLQVYRLMTDPVPRPVGLGADLTRG